MKKISLLLIILIFSLFLPKCTFTPHSNTADFNIEKITTLCKVWGALKYYHPAVGSGEFDWDIKLLESIKLMDEVTSKKQLNEIILGLITFCDTVNINVRDTFFLSGSYVFSRQLNWLEDTTYLSSYVTQRIKTIVNKKISYINHYVSQNYLVGNLDYSNELPYSDSVFPSKNLRLLALFRFWNVIYYFYPYLEINDISWTRILKKYIPELINVKDSLEYHMKILELTSELNDGHIWTESLPIALHLGIFSPPYKVECIEDKAIVTDLFPDSLGSLYNIEIGDQILSIDNTPVSQIIIDRSKYYSYSNQYQHKRRIYEELLITSNKDSIILEINRENVVFQEIVPTYYLFELYEILNREEAAKPAYTVINDTIGYINLRYLDNTEVDSMMSELIELKKIIIDLRNYPRGVLYNLSKHLNSDSIEFVKIFIPDIVHPGKFIWWEDPLYTGNKNVDYFKGKVILIVNEKTQSHAEFTAMCLQTAPNVITIGSTTAGTDGNVSYLYLPGGISTMFTGIGIEYPDGTPTQRKGIKIDSIIRPRAIDIRNSYDRLLNFAISM
jgi:C-terminal processing protease CtpA/Prc